MTPAELQSRREGKRWLAFLLAVFLVALAGAYVVGAVDRPALVKAATPEQKVEQKLTNEAHARCTALDTYAVANHMVVVDRHCYSADAMCWWRNAPYYNGKCWNVFYVVDMLKKEAELPDAWLFCERPAWWDMLGRVTRRGRWVCIQNNGPLTAA